MIIPTILALTAATAVAAAVVAKYTLNRSKYHNEQQQHLVTQLNKDVDILRDLLEDRRKHYVSDFEAVHNRINLSNVRHMHIEHYIGLRSHSFSNGERMWDYFQIAKDLRTGNAERPKSKFRSTRRS